MANKIVSLLLQVKNKLSPGTKEATADLEKLENRSRSLERELNRLENAKKAAEGLDAARKAALDAEKAFDKAQLEVEELKIALKSEKTPELAVALVKARDSARDAKKEWRESAKNVTQLEKAVQSAGGDLNNLGETQKRLNTEITKTSGAVKYNKQQLDKSRGSLEETAKSSEKVGNSFKNLVAKAAALVGIVAIVNRVRAAMTSLATSVWETGNQFEQFEKRLNATEFGYIEEFIRTAPLGLDDVADAFLRLKNFGMDPMDGTLQALVDKNAQLGGSMEDLNGIILQLGQGWTKQKLQSQDIIAIMERGIPVWDLLSDALGKTAGEVQDMVSAGQIGRREIKLLIDAMGDSAVGAAADQMDSMTGAVAMLQSQFTVFYKEIADAGVWEYIKGQLAELTSYIDEMARNGQLKEFAKNISDGFIAAAEATRSFVTTIYDLRGVLGLVAKAWLGLKIASWAGQLSNAGKGFVGLAGSAAAATTAMKALATAMKATVALAIVQGVWEITTAYKDLKIAVAELDKTKAAEAQSSAELANRYKEISEATGVTVKNMKDLDAAIDSGSIVIDELTNQYLSAEQATKLFAQRQQELQQEVGKASVDAERLSGSYRQVSESLKEAVEDNSKLASVLKKELLTSLNAGVEGIGGFALALKSAEQQGSLTAEQISTELKASIASLSDEEQARFGKLIEQAMKQVASGADSAGLRVKDLQGMLDSLNTSRVESALKKLGVTSQAEFAKMAAASKEAFEVIQQSGAPLEDQRKAFLAYAKTAIEANKDVADAQRANVVEQLRVVAASLGMSDQLRELIGLQQELGDQGVTSGEQIRRGAESGADGMNELSDATEQATGRTQGLGMALANLLNGARDDLLQLSEATAALFDSKLGIESSGVLTETEALKAAIAGLKNEIGDMYLAAARPDFTGISSFISKVNQAHGTSKLAFQEQKLAAVQLIQEMNNAGNVTQGTINKASAALSQLNLLGQEDLGPLRSALDSANSKLQAMNDNAKSTLDSLQNQLDRLQDNQAAIQQRDYQHKRTQLVNAIEDARRIRNQNAAKQHTEALSLLEKVRNEQNKQLQKSQQEQRAQEQARRQSEQQAAKQTTAASKKVDISLNLNGKKTNLSAANQSEADALLRILEQAGMTTL